MCPHRLYGIRLRVQGVENVQIFRYVFYESPPIVKRMVKEHIFAKDCIQLLKNNTPHRGIQRSFLLHILSKRELLLKLL